MSSEDEILALIRREMADILGYEDWREVSPDTAFMELGLSSLAAVELASRLSAHLGREIPVALGFDHPTPALLARHLAADPSPVAVPVLQEPEQPQGLTDPVAIVGMSCRYPGAASPEALWELVAAGREAISPFPTDRGWDLDALFDPDPDSTGHSYVSAGGFLKEVAEFDADFFGISPREAIAMDPQQRLLLEESWTAIERAGIDPLSLRGTRAAVYMGVATHEYYGAHAAAVPGHVEGWFGIGTAGSVASGRIAHVLGLTGPALTLDTACSSSLVCVHLACRALKLGECSLALAGGVTVMATPLMFTEFSRQRALSGDGRCRSFSDDADGTSWSEGVGIVVLERLSDALRAGHPVLALVAGSAVNQDGTSNGLTAPNGLAQQQVIRDALADAGLSTEQVDVVEAHGTATPLGDPVEASALLATYGRDRPAERPLWLGSLKSNLGHSQAAAGVGGIVKMVMALHHELLPPTLHVARPSRHVDWSAGTVRLLTDAATWPRHEAPRRAAVSAFGISGTNAHVVLEEPPAAVDQTAAAPDSPTVVAVPLVVSARTTDALRAQADALGGLLRSPTPPDPAAVAHALLETRSRFALRAVVVGSHRAALAQGLAALSEGHEADGVAVGTARERRVAFVYPGHGSQWRGMAVELARTSPVFREALDTCAAALQPHIDWSLSAVLHGEDGAPDFDRVDVVQTVLFASMVALTELWRSCGVHPDVVVGHSLGEIAAAWAGGWLSLEDACRVVGVRGRLLRDLAGTGGILAISAPADEVVERIRRWADRLWVAGVNGPNMAIVSGDNAALEELRAACESSGLWTGRVAIDFPSHTPYVERIRAELLDGLELLAPRRGPVEMRSTLTGQPVGPGELDADYWYRNVREPVRFHEVVSGLVRDGIDTFIEVDTHPVLAPSVLATIEAESAAATDADVVGTLRRGQGDLADFLRSLAKVFVWGVDVDFDPVLPESHGPRVSLPTYPFTRRRYWLEPTTRQSSGVAHHPLLDGGVEVASTGRRLFAGRLSLDDHPWLADHVVMDHVVVSGTTMVEFALAAGRALGYDAVEELTLELPLLIAPGEPVEVQVDVAAADPAGRCAVEIHARPATGRGDAPWSRYASGILATDPGDVAQAPSPVERSVEVEWPPVGAEPVDVDRLYQDLGARGLEYGPAYRGVRRAWRRGRSAFAEVAGTEVAAGDDFVVHPALLDAMLHSAVLIPAASADDDAGAWLPFTWSGVQVATGGAPSCRVEVTATGEGEYAVQAVSPDNRPIARVASLVTRSISPERLAALDAGSKDTLFHLAWTPAEAPGSRGGSGPRRAVPAAEPPDAPELPVWTADAPVDAFERLRRQTVELFHQLREWLGDPRYAEVDRFVVVTRGGVQVSGEEGQPDVGAAAVWGLVRAAQMEHPGRFLLVDVDHGPLTPTLLGEVLASQEPQLAVRAGQLFCPRLTPTRLTPPAAADRPRWSPDGTVAVTGGTGVLGALVARHLAGVHGVRNLLLLSRQGPQAPGAPGLADELRSLGAEVAIQACDVTDRAALAAALDTIPGAHPLTGVVHCAGVLADGVIESLDEPAFDRVLAPKVGAALHLDQLTQDADLEHFVLFSSVAGVAGSAGQANYAAANAALDGLAARRRAQGRPAVSLAWGWWEPESAMTGKLGSVDRARLQRAGLKPLSVDDGLALLDAAVVRNDVLTVPAAVDRAALRAAADQGLLPPVLTQLVGTRRTAGTAGGPASALASLAGLGPEERAARVEEIILDHLAAILGYDGREAVDPRRSFKDLGLDSLGAVQLRNSLITSTGLRLPSTLAFDHPTPAALAAFLLAQPDVSGGAAEAPQDQAVRRLDALLGAIGDLELDRQLVVDRLSALAARLSVEVDDAIESDEGALDRRISDASAEELFALLDGHSEAGS